MINHDKLTFSPIDHGYVFAMAFRLKCHEVSVEFGGIYQPAMLTPEWCCPSFHPGPDGPDVLDPHP